MRTEPWFCASAASPRGQGASRASFSGISSDARGRRRGSSTAHRLIWSKLKLLEEAELERMGVIARAMGVVIQALYSDAPRRQMWASDKIMSSWLARDHPLAPARREPVAQTE